MPVLREVHEEVKDSGSTLLAINITPSDKLTDVQALVDTEGITYPVLLDERSEVSAQYGIRSIPTIVVIDKDGVVVEHSVGGMNKEQLLELLEDNR